MSTYEMEIPDKMFEETADPETRGQEFLLQAIDIGLQSGVIATQLDYASNAEAQYVGRNCSPSGWRTSPEISVKYESPLVDVEVTVKEGPNLDFVATNDPELEITLDELHDGHSCPVCGEEFDTVVWENITDFSDNDEAKWVYACPTDCDGRVVLLTD